MFVRIALELERATSVKFADRRDRLAFEDVVIMTNGFLVERPSVSGSSESLGYCQELAKLVIATWSCTMCETMS